MAGRNKLISQMSAGLPDVSNVFNNWEISITANYVSQNWVDGEPVNVTENKMIKGIKQPLKAEEIALKEEGQRSWSWQQIHVREALYGELYTSQILTIGGVNYKIKAKKDFVLNGYREYHAILDYEDASA